MPALLLPGVLLVLGLPLLSRFAVEPVPASILIEINCAGRVPRVQGTNQRSGMVDCVLLYRHVGINLLTALSWFKILSGLVSKASNARSCLHTPNSHAAIRVGFSGHPPNEVNGDLRCCYFPSIWAAKRSASQALWNLHPRVLPFRHPTSSFPTGPLLLACRENHSTWRVFQRCTISSLAYLPG